MVVRPHAVALEEDASTRACAVCLEMKDLPVDSGNVAPRPPSPTSAVGTRLDPPPPAARLSFTVRPKGVILTFVVCGAGAAGSGRVLGKAHTSTIGAHNMPQRSITLIVLCALLGLAASASSDYSSCDRGNGNCK
eukprot:COSAG01_NODE_5124_length_4470_cov_10.204987_7_plen_135_part_00